MSSGLISLGWAAAATLVTAAVSDYALRHPPELLQKMEVDGQNVIEYCNALRSNSPVTYWALLVVANAATYGALAYGVSGAVQGPHYG